MDHTLFNLAVRKVSSRTEKKKTFTIQDKMSFVGKQGVELRLIFIFHFARESSTVYAKSAYGRNTALSVTYSMVLKSISPPTKGRSGAEVLGARYLWFCLQDALGNPWYLVHSTMGNFCAIETLRPDLRVFWHCHRKVRTGWECLDSQRTQISGTNEVPNSKDQIRENQMDNSLCSGTLGSVLHLVPGGLKQMLAGPPTVTY